MEEIMWHRRESRRQTEKTNFFLSSGSLLSTRPRIYRKTLAFFCTCEVPAGSIMRRSDACLTSAPVSSDFMESRPTYSSRIG